MRGLNMIHGSRNRSGFRHYFDATCMTLLLIVVALVAMGSVVIMPVVLAFLRISWEVELLIDLARWAMATGAVIIGVGVLYRFGPYQNAIRGTFFSPGAVIFLTLWVIASSGFSIYLSRFGNYNQVLSLIHI